MLLGFNIRNKGVPSVGPELPNPPEKTRGVHREESGPQRAPSGPPDPRCQVFLPSGV